MALTPVEQQPEKASSAITNLFPSIPSVKHCCRSWEDTKVQLMQLMDLMPDLTTITEVAEVLTRGTVLHYATAFRVAFASFCVLNFTLLKNQVPAVKELISRLVHKPINRSLAPGHVVRLTYWSSLVAVFTALGVLGLKEFAQMLSFTTTSVQAALNLAFPWLGYGMRVGGILQGMDLVAGHRFQRQMDSALACDEKIATVWSEVPKEHALKVLDVIEQNRHYVRRTNGYGKGLKKRVVALKQQMQQPLKTDVLASLRTYNEIMDLAKGLREKSSERSKYQAIGFGANLFAVGVMVSTNAVALPLLSLASASLYIAQSIYGWHGTPNVSYEPKSAVAS
ncbi:MAG: hypothetical protein E6Q59_00905 [Nitrosomonas sp.]|nr:MAG: hypothetical protein E6Q59_00905 [Nitrosomonas sp.]